MATRAKRVALIGLAVVSFASPLLERAVTGRVEEFGAFAVADLAVSLTLLFWWYHVDKREHHYEAGGLMNAGVLVLAAVALPVYFIRSRGWKGGALATALAAAFLAVTLALGELGERLAAFFG